MRNIKRFTVIRDGHLYDSSDNLAVAIQHCRSFQESWNGIWQVLDRKHANREEYKVGPTTTTKN